MVSIKLSYDPIGDQVREIIRNRILDGTYPAGKRLIEADLAAEFQVSRTPIRDAILRLEVEGLVTVVPRKGIVVRRVTEDDVAEIFEIRLALEPLATQLASQNRTQSELERLELLLTAMEKSRSEGNTDELATGHMAFHRFIYELAGRPRLLNMLSSILDDIRRFSQRSYRNAGRDKVAMAEHRMMVDAIRGKDKDLSYQVSKQHILAARDAYLNLVDSHQA